MQKGQLHSVHAMGSDAARLCALAKLQTLHTVCIALGLDQIGRHQHVMCEHAHADTKCLLHDLPCSTSASPSDSLSESKKARERRGSCWLMPAPNASVQLGPGGREHLGRSQEQPEASCTDFLSQAAADWRGLTLPGQPVQTVHQVSTQRCSNASQ